MAISFYCPMCQNFCSCEEEDAGKRASCQACDQEFVIPEEDGGAAVKVKAVRDAKALPGFWKAVFGDTPKLLTVGENVTGIVFVCAMMGFKFFCGHINFQFFTFYMPLGFIIRTICWGCICWYLMCVIRAAYEEQDELPDIEIGFGFEFFGNVFGSIYLFICAFLIPILPFILLYKLSVRAGFNISSFQNGFIYCGIFFFPICVLLICVAKGLWVVFWPVNLIVPMLKHPIAYLFTASVVILSAAVHMLAYNYVTVENESNVIIAVHFAANIGAGLLSIVAMRVVGLFGRHYV